MCNTRGSAFRDTSWCSEIKRRLLLLTENIGRNVVHSRAYPGGMLSVHSGCIGGVFVTWGTPVSLFIDYLI
jgi:hypothetical protein